MESEGRHEHSRARTGSRVDCARAKAGADHRLGGHGGLGGIPEAARAADGRAWAHPRVDLPIWAHNDND